MTVGHLRVPLRLESLTDSVEYQAAAGNVDHGLGDVEALLVVTHQAAPTDEPAEGALHHPAARQHLEARLGVDAAHYFDDEFEEGDLVHELAAVVGAVGQEMLQPRPALADVGEDHLGSGAVGDVGGGEVGHQELAVGVDGNVALAELQAEAFNQSGPFFGKFGIAFQGRPLQQQGSCPGQQRLALPHPTNAATLRCIFHFTQTRVNDSKCTYASPFTSMLL